MARDWIPLPFVRFRKPIGCIAAIDEVIGGTWFLYSSQILGIDGYSNDLDSNSVGREAVKVEMKRVQAIVQLAHVPKR